MPLFTVHEPPNPPADRLQRADTLVLVRDGFGWSAALTGPVWLAFGRHWQLAGLWVGVVAAVAGIVWLTGVSHSLTALVALAGNLLIGLEAADIQRDRFEADGWAALGEANGRNEAEAEAEFFARWLAPDDAGSVVSGASARPT